MRRLNSTIIACLFLLGAETGFAQELPEMPEMPKPTKDHAWLEQLAGKWDTETEIFAIPGQPPIKVKGEENSRMIGDFWYLAEAKGDMMGMPYTGIMTLGYDAEKKSYVGTWVDSMGGYMWNYTGTVGDGGKTLTLETKGPCPMKPGQIVDFKEVFEINDKDHKVFTSSMKDEDGKWTKIMTVSYKRKK
jgi:Protein of unknown function (DUF1579)